MRTAPGSCIIEGEKGGKPKIQVEIKSPLTECPVSERGIVIILAQTISFVNYFLILHT